MTRYLYLFDLQKFHFLNIVVPSLIFFDFLRPSITLQFNNATVTH
jgi:hypothetical protein